jgi:hypothetical protein
MARVVAGQYFQLAPDGGAVERIEDYFDRRKSGELAPHDEVVTLGGQRHETKTEGARHRSGGDSERVATARLRRGPTD